MILAPNNNPLTTPEPWNDIADGYAEEMLPVLEAYIRVGAKPKSP